MLVADPLVQQVIGCAIEVHRHLGPGLLESVYDRCLRLELGSHRIGYTARRQVPVVYKGLELNCGYCVDLIVEDRLVIELKAIEQLLPVHKAQVITYLKLLRLPQGLLINFNVPRLVDGVRSVLLTSQVTHETTQQP